MAGHRRHRTMLTSAQVGVWAGVDAWRVILRGGITSWTFSPLEGGR